MVKEVPYKFWIFVTYSCKASKFHFLSESNCIFSLSSIKRLQNIMRTTTKWTTYIHNQVAELRNALGPLSGRSMRFCSDACLLRYLYARNWDVDKSKKMLEETLKWRSTYKPEEIRWVILMINHAYQYKKKMFWLIIVPFLMMIPYDLLHYIRMK